MIPFVSQIFIQKRLRSPVIDSEESISQANVAWRSRQSGNRFLGSLKGLNIRALFYPSVNSRRYVYFSAFPNCFYG